MDIKTRFKIANDCRSKDETRPFINECYYQDEKIISTDGKRLFGMKWSLDHGNGYCKIDKDNVFPIVMSGTFSDWKKAVHIDPKEYESISLDIPKYFSKFKCPINAGITIKSEFILNYSESTEHVVIMNLQYLSLFADNTITMHYKNENSVIVFTDNTLDDLHNQEWFYFVMPIRGFKERV